jgi:hypothetical protein
MANWLNCRHFALVSPCHATLDRTIKYIDLKGVSQLMCVEFLEKHKAPYALSFIAALPALLFSVAVHTNSHYLNVHKTLLHTHQALNEH